MSDNNKKRGNSFRKIFPNLFFSNKSKEKTTIKNKSHKMERDSSTSRNNYYQNPQTVLPTCNNRAEVEQESDDRIYENLSTSIVANTNDTNSIDVLSNHSSSSTLVSENGKNMKLSVSKIETDDIARPQVPPKPQSETYSSQCHISYPDVYYHSLDKLTDKISPLDEIEIYRASRAQASPASVGAEIKKVSTKFLISPKKESNVRTIQPIRARSLSPDKDNLKKIDNEHKEYNKEESYVEKPYNYSAPTSPVAISHKIPNMPTTVSPYEHVRKTMIEAEEKRNSINRFNLRNMSTPSPRPFSSIPTSPLLNKERSKIDESLKKEKTRQKVEAFYWQKIKELKHREDEYLLRQSLNSSMGGQNAYNRTNSNSNCSSPNSFMSDSRSHTLPPGVNINSSVHHGVYLSSPFIRGAPERRTDSVISNRTLRTDDDIIYRYPKKLAGNKNIRPEMSALKNNNTLPSKVTSTGQSYSAAQKNNSLNVKYLSGGYNNRGSEPFPLKLDYSAKNLNNPPQPPLRTTSVASSSGTFRLTVNNKNVSNLNSNALRSMCSESESGSEAGEIQRIIERHAHKDEDWQGDLRYDGGLSDGEPSRGLTRGRPSRREDPRRHTLAGNHNIYMHQHHPAHISTIDIEPPLLRYPPPNNALLFDDDPGVMSEVETASTGFRRGGKQRSSLPVVRTPSKTLERPLGLVFLQYRNETKRALLPNEITSIDTVKALFVRSFPKQLTMQYMDSENVKIYIHENTKDMFYELEDVRSHLRDIRDRSVIRLFEDTDIGGGTFPGAMGVGSFPMPTGSSSASSSTWGEPDQNYFSEPEIDCEYHSQHVHNKNKVKAPAYYMGVPPPPTLPRGGGAHMRAYSPSAPVPADRNSCTASHKPMRSYVPGSGSEHCFPCAAAECPRAHSGDGNMSSPERVAPRPYDEPYYGQFLGPAAVRPPCAPPIDEDLNESMIDDAYQMYGANPITTAPRPMPRPPYDARHGPPVDDMQRLRVEKMERQLANLTGLVQKALQVPAAPVPSAPPAPAPRQECPNHAGRPAAPDAARFASNERPPKLGRDRFQKSVSFEKSVSFSDDPPDLNSPIQHSPQHAADTKPTKPAIKSSTLPRTSSQERDRLKPAPPPKPAGLSSQQLALVPQRTTTTLDVTPDFFAQLRTLQKQSRDLRIETRNLRRSTLSHSIQMRQMMAETIVKIGDIAASLCEDDPNSLLTREEEIYRQEILLLENNLYELEANVERLRDQAANRDIRVNVADVENIAFVLSKSSKTVADWKVKFPVLQETMKAKLTAEMEKIVRKEKILEDEPERLELALRRCKKLTGTLVTLKRLACVQEQRMTTDGSVSPSSSLSAATAGLSSEENRLENAIGITPPNNKGGVVGRAAACRGAADLRPENALDALLDELQTFSKSSERSGQGDGPLRRLHSYPSGSDTDASPPVRARGQHPPKPPVPERHPELLAMAVRRAPPPPPPRTTSRSPLASPTSPSSPPRPDSSNSTDEKSSSRQALLEQRHQELLKKQKALQEQYARLQMIQRSGSTLPPNAQPDLKKTGSESNLLTKMNLNLAPASISGSMTHLAGDGDKKRNDATCDNSQLKPPDAVPTTNKVYETDIL